METGRVIKVTDFFIQMQLQQHACIPSFTDSLRQARLLTKRYDGKPTHELDHGQTAFSINWTGFDRCTREPMIAMLVTL